MKLKFIRNSDDFVIIANEENGTYKIKLVGKFLTYYNNVMNIKKFLSLLFRTFR